jgi:hypothetical protein
MFIQRSRQKYTADDIPERGIFVREFLRGKKWVNM